ncbi:MAG: hypothetical protein JNK79_20690 [Chitinophagaceae bacterium]|nr:hypothetical protein [Chitinophagaceae bacterium]
MPDFAVKKHLPVYASDVLAGFLIGLTWLLVALAVVAKAEDVAAQLPVAALY